MAVATRSVHHALIHVPLHGGEHGALAAHVAATRQACRIAYLTGETPIAPYLFYLTFLSEGELNVDRTKVTMQWLRRSDRIWLHSSPREDPNGVLELDALGYKILSENLESTRRRAVFELMTNPKDPLGLTAVPLTVSDVELLLSMNVAAMLAACA